MRGRIRTVKPEALKDEELWDLEVATGLPIYRAFQGLWMFADREGRFEWRPRALKSDILPYWEGGFEAVLDALVSKGFISRYSVDGRDYGLVPKLSDHQRFDHREPASTLPAPPFEEARPGTPGQSSALPVSDPGNARVEGKGREQEGKGREGECPPGTPLPRALPRPRRVGIEDASGVPVVHRTLKGWDPPPELEGEAVMANISREYFRLRVKQARNKPIGGKDGVFSREQWVRDQFPFWVVDQRSQPARASPTKHGSRQGNAGLTGFESVEAKTT